MSASSLSSPKTSVIKTINTDEFWAANDILAFETIRRELRDLMKFLVEPGGNKPITTNLTDPVLSEDEGVPMPVSYDFEDYRKKSQPLMEIIRAIKENAITVAA